MKEFLSSPNIQYALITLILLALYIVYAKLNTKLNITNKEKEDLQIALSIMEFLNKNVKNEKIDNEKVNKIIKYIKEAMEFVDKYDKQENIEEKKRLITVRTLSFCKENKIEVDDETIELVDKLINYVVDAI